MRQSYLIRLVQLHPLLQFFEGTKKANKIETKIAPITILRVLLPTIDSTSKAKRLCNCVSCIAAKNNAATNATADVENPLNACVNAFPCLTNLRQIIFYLSFGLPSFSDSCWTGLNPQIKMIKPKIIVLILDTSASVTHIITANAKMASAPFAIIGNPAGVGNNKIINKMAKLIIIQIGL